MDFGALCLHDDDDLTLRGRLMSRDQALQALEALKRLPRKQVAPSTEPSTCARGAAGGAAASAGGGSRGTPGSATADTGHVSGPGLIAKLDALARRRAPEHLDLSRRSLHAEDLDVDVLHEAIPVLASLLARDVRVRSLDLSGFAADGPTGIRLLGSLGAALRINSSLRSIYLWGVTLPRDPNPTEDIIGPFVEDLAVNKGLKYLCHDLEGLEAADIQRALQPTTALLTMDPKKRSARRTYNGNPGDEFLLDSKSLAAVTETLEKRERTRRHSGTVGAAVNAAVLAFRVKQKRAAAARAAARRAEGHRPSLISRPVPGSGTEPLRSVAAGGVTTSVNPASPHGLAAIAELGHGGAGVDSRVDSTANPLGPQGGEAEAKKIAAAIEGVRAQEKRESEDLEVPVEDLGEKLRAGYVTGTYRIEPQKWTAETRLALASGFLGFLDVLSDVALMVQYYSRGLVTRRYDWFALSLASVVLSTGTNSLFLMFAGRFRSAALNLIGLTGVTDAWAVATGASYSHIRLRLMDDTPLVGLESLHRLKAVESLFESAPQAMLAFYVGFTGQAAVDGSDDTFLQTKLGLSSALVLYTSALISCVMLTSSLAMADRRAAKLNTEREGFHGVTELELTSLPVLSFLAYRLLEVTSRLMTVVLFAAVVRRYVLVTLVMLATTYIMLGRPSLRAGSWTARVATVLSLTYATVAFPGVASTVQPWVDNNLPGLAVPLRARTYADWRAYKFARCAEDLLMLMVAAAVVEWGAPATKVHTTALLFAGGMVLLRTYAFQTYVSGAFAARGLSIATADFEPMSVIEAAKAVRSMPAPGEDGAGARYKHAEFRVKITRLFAQAEAAAASAYIRGAARKAVTIAGGAAPEAGGSADPDAAGAASAASAARRASRSGSGAAASPGTSPSAAADDAAHGVVNVDFHGMHLTPVMCLLIGSVLSSQRDGADAAPVSPSCAGPVDARPTMGARGGGSTSGMVHIVNLSDCHLDDLGASYILDALQDQPDVTEIDLRKNKLTDMTAERLARTGQDDSNGKDRNADSAAIRQAQSRKAQGPLLCSATCQGHRGALSVHSLAPVPPASGGKDAVLAARAGEACHCLLRLDDNPGISDSGAIAIAGALKRRRRVRRVTFNPVWNDLFDRLTFKEGLLSLPADPSKEGPKRYYPGTAEELCLAKGDGVRENGTIHGTWSSSSKLPWAPRAVLVSYAVLSLMDMASDIALVVSLWVADRQWAALLSATFVVSAMAANLYALTEGERPMRFHLFGVHWLLETFIVVLDSLGREPSETGCLRRYRRSTCKVLVDDDEPCWGRAGLNRLKRQVALMESLPQAILQVFYVLTVAKSDVQARLGGLAVIVPLSLTLSLLSVAANAASLRRMETVNQVARKVTKRGGGFHGSDSMILRMFLADFFYICIEVFAFAGVWAFVAFAFESTFPLIFALVGVGYWGLYLQLTPMGETAIVPVLLATVSFPGAAPPSLPQWLIDTAVHINAARKPSAPWRYNGWRTLSEAVLLLVSFFAHKDLADAEGADGDWRRWWFWATVIICAARATLLELYNRLRAAWCLQYEVAAERTRESSRQAAASSLTIVSTSPLSAAAASTGPSGSGANGASAVSPATLRRPSRAS